METEVFQTKYGKKKSLRKKKNFDGSASIVSRLRSMNLPFVQEFRFSEHRNYAADFAIGKILIEYDGGTWVKGGHSTGTGINRDAEKANLATLHGFTYLRFTSDLLKRPRYFENVVLAALMLPERNL